MYVRVVFIAQSWTRIIFNILNIFHNSFSELYGFYFLPECGKRLVYVFPLF